MSLLLDSLDSDVASVNDVVPGVAAEEQFLEQQLIWGQICVYIVFIRSTPTIQSCSVNVNIYIKIYV